MAHTYTKLTYHAAFSTKGRRQLISEGLRERLHPYVGAIVSHELGFTRQVGGTADHIHILFDLKPTITIADALRTIKSVSSGWVHREFPDLRDFQWQEGYGAFTVSASRVPDTARYIEDQEEHHRAMTFQEEFLALLRKHGIEYDPRHLWD